ncbi:MAG: tetratricopeptide repeat protein [Clostridia bacterium]|nr:tetratricopeptide repeat protein [Clostridia bacterium]
MSFTDELKPGDYTEPECPLCMTPPEKRDAFKPINVRRAIEKADEYFAVNDPDGAGRILEYWLGEAELGGDLRGAFAMHNELMGLYRKKGDGDKASFHADAALRIASETGLDGNMSGGTAYINAATVSKAFGRPEEAMERFQRAEEILSSLDGVPHSLLGGLNNNMALALCDLGRYDEAAERYQRALSEMEQTENGEAERAVTYLNMADAAEANLGPEDGAELISEYVEKAYALITAESLPKDGDYAYYCATCAPSFDYYGYFAYADELRKRAGEIYERGNKRT